MNPRVTCLGAQRTRARQTSTQQDVNAKKSWVLRIIFSSEVTSSVPFYNVSRQVFPTVRLARYVSHLGFSFSKISQIYPYPWLSTTTICLPYEYLMFTLMFTIFHLYPERATSNRCYLPCSLVKTSRKRRLFNAITYLRMETLSLLL
jgi:hypothetical protein